MDSRRIPSLDGLRGVAILMVLIGHGLHSLPPSAARWLKFAGNGLLGVNVFFVLSGFLIYNLAVREIEKTGAFSWRQFYLRRVLRIFPCFYFYLGVVLLLTQCGVLSLSWQILVSAGTFSLNYRHLWDHSAGVYDYDAVGHYWTLALEEQFYLTWPLFILLFNRRKLVPVLVTILALAPLLRVACYFLTPGSRGQLFMMFHTGFDAIAAGVLLGELLRRARPRAWLERVASAPFVVAGTVVFLLFVSPFLGERMRGAYGLTVGRDLDFLGLCIVVTAAVSFPQTFLFRVLNWRPLVYVGILSYSLYVWNNLFLLGDRYWFNVFPYNDACAVGMALLSHYLIENPFLKLKERFHKDALRPA